MSEFSDFSQLPPPSVPDPAFGDMEDDRDDDASAAALDDGGTEHDERADERAGTAGLPEAVANNYRFAGLVTLIPEEAASVDHLA
ncbi:hypothetical protein [Citreimonas salinaria]|uniref:hypothetical protein n=1 Tax=Citreimonas salinaria TaxID=321339 RepID=UPI00115FCD55|nr:hypothetical protein [Citreimonas salinaria]